MSTPGGIVGSHIIVGVPTAGASGNTNDVPIALGNASDGALITGTASGRNASGAVILRTAQGDVTLATDLYLKRGVEVMLQLDRSGSQPTARIVTVDGLSLGKYLGSMQGREGDSVHTSSLGNPALATDPVDALAGTGQTTATAPTAASSPANPAVVEARLVGEPATLPPDLLAALPEPVAEALTKAAPGSSVMLTVLKMTLPDALAMAVPLEASPPAAAVSLAPMPSTGLSIPSAVSMPTVNSVPAGLIASAPAIANPAAPEAPVPAAPVSAMTAPITPTPPGATSLAPAQLAGLAIYGKLVSGGMATAPSPTAKGTPISPPPAIPLSVSPAIETHEEGTASTSATTAPIVTETSASLTPVSNAEHPVLAFPLTGSAPTTLPASEPVPLGPNPTPTALSTAQPATPVNQPIPPSSPTIEATVIGSSGPGELILQTPAGTLKLMNTPPLPLGTRLDLQIDTVAAAPVEPTSPLPAASGLPSLSGLDALQEADAISLSTGPVQQTIAAQLMAQAATAATNLLPRPGKEMMRDMLLLFSVLSGSTDTRKWLGERRIDALQALGKTGMLGRIEGELGMLRTNFSAGSPEGWNQMLVPFQVGAQVEPVQLFWKRRRADPARLGEGDQEHFLIDLRVSRWGRLQLDGLVKKQTPLGFDLTIRSEQALTAADERTIGDIYRQAASGAGFTGSLMFRHGATACVALPNQPVAAEHSIVV